MCIRLPTTNCWWSGGAIWIDRHERTNSTIAKPVRVGRAWWDATTEGANYTGIGKCTDDYTHTGTSQVLVVPKCRYLGVN